MTNTTMQALGIAAHARTRPDHVALVSPDARFTYAELDLRARKTAAVLQQLGAGPNGRVAIVLRNRPEFFEAAAAAAMLGAEVVPVGWRLGADEAAYLIEDSQAVAVIAEHDAVLQDALRVGGDYEAARDAATPISSPDEVTPVRFRYYTSGTTGRPKAIERERRPLDEYLAGVMAFPPLAGLTGTEEIHLVCGPLYHTAPCGYAHYALLAGHTVVLMERFDARDCLETIERERVTWSHMVPINFVRILAVNQQFDLSSVRKILHAAAPCPVDVKRKIMNVFPPGTVWEYYGATEGFGTIISPEEWLVKPGSAGRGAVAILDDDGKPLKPGETGLVYIQGARFEYAGAPEKTNEAWRGDMFTVGDMGYLDDDGYLFLNDRKQDMIISGGANVYPAEVESALHKHPAVADVAVIGVPDDEWGERVLAIVETNAPVTSEDLIAFCRDQIAHYKCPREIAFVERLPRDESGKVRKRDLREPYWTGRETRI